MAFFKNDYKVIYNSWKKENKLHLFATKNLPAASDDSLIYRNELGEELTAEDIKAIKLVYSKGETIYYTTSRLPSANDHKLSGYHGDEVVFGEDVTPVEKFPVTVNDVANCTTTGAGEYAEGKPVKVTVAPASGYKFSTGNAPKANGVDMVNEGTCFSYSFTMPAAATAVTITGVAVETIPAEGYWLAPTTKPTAIGEDWNAIATISKPEQSVVYPGSADMKYPAFACRKSLGNILAVYQPAMPSTDILANFDASEVTFHGEVFNLYVHREESLAENEDQFDFCFAPRN